MRAAPCETGRSPRATVHGPTHFSLPAGEVPVFSLRELGRQNRCGPAPASPRSLPLDLNPLTATEFSRALALSLFSPLANREKQRSLPSDVGLRFATFLELRVELAEMLNQKSP